MNPTILSVLKRYLISMIFLPSFIVFFHQGNAQNAQDFQQIRSATNIPALEKFSAEMKTKAGIKRNEAEKMASKQGWILKKEDENGNAAELKELRSNGMPVYFSSGNLTSAKTISTSKVWSGGGLGLNLSGNGITLREWDQSAVRKTHQELAGRVTQGDGVTALSAHSTHVAGTMMATGVVANAHGMANQSTLRAFDWWYDYAEMASEAAAGALLSNHSYIFITGWYNSGSWYWYGDPAISQVEDYTYGFYGDDASIVDTIAFNAPYYLICKAAGNEKGYGPSSQPVSHYVWDGTNWVTSSVIRNVNGMPSGYDCISNGFGVSKNVLTVGAVYGIPNGYTAPSDVVLASFSSTGPCDDGRIKPDIVTDGVGLYSTYSTADNAYASMSGTSMATPGAAGSLALLQECYHNLHGVYMRAATLKALVIHSADEAGSNPGPDYQFGWGLMNTAKAANLIANNSSALIRELSLGNGNVYTLDMKANGTEPLRATICWTDVPGNPPAPALNPPDIMLVNDLDIRIDGNTYKPWILDRANPSAAAATGDNIRDNVEQIYIPGITAGCHVLTVSHKGTLSGGAQAFSLILSGISVYPDFVAGTISGSQTICSGTSPALLTGTSPSGGNPPYAFQWQKSSDNISFSDISGATGQNYQSGILTATTHYRLKQSAAGSCNTAFTNGITVTVNPLPLPTLAGASNLCVNSGNYYYTTESGMSNYTWMISSGGLIFSGNGSNTVEAGWNQSGAQWVSVAYTNQAGCNPAAPKVLAVNVNSLPAPAGTISGTSGLCAGTSGIAYSINPVPDAATYIWTLPPGAVIVSGQTTSSITVGFSVSALSGNIFVAGNNNCGNGIPSPGFQVLVNPVPGTPVIVQQGDYLISDALEGNQWYDINGMIAGADAQIFSPPANGLYRDIVSILGCSSFPSEWFPFVMTGMENESLLPFRVYPNPAQGLLHLETKLEKPCNIRAELYNPSGLPVKIADWGFCPAGFFHQIIPCDEISSGIYFLKIRCEAETKVYKVIINGRREP